MENSAISKFEKQPTNLSDKLVTLVPLTPNDFEKLFAVASDPLIWEQHPSKTRYQREVFETFFNGAIESKGAFFAFDTATNEPIGSSRFYDLNEETKSIKIGYTFLSRNCWGKGHNESMKSLMINHVFKYLENVFFEIGSNNIRSQKAIGKLGAIKVGQEEIAYACEPTVNLNYIYTIDKESWYESK